MKNSYVHIHDFEWKVMCIRFGCTNEKEAMEVAKDCACYEPLLQHNANPLTCVNKTLCSKLRHGNRGGKSKSTFIWLLVSHDLIIEGNILTDMGRLGTKKIDANTFVALILYNSKSRFEMSIETVPCGQLSKAYPNSLREDAYALRPTVLVRTRQGHIIPLSVEELFKVSILHEEVGDLIPCIHGTYEADAEFICT